MKNIMALRQSQKEQDKHNENAAFPLSANNIVRFKGEVIMRIKMAKTLLGA